MSSAAADVALLTDRRWTAAAADPDDWYFANILADDRLLSDALADRGLSSRRVDWSDPTVDWERHRALVFRTTWDYYDRQAEFAEWLAAVSPRCLLVNDAATVRWNVDKHYLADLAAAGVAVVPTVFLEPGSGIDLAAELAARGWGEGVVKPAVSGGARLTHRFDVRTAPDVARIVAPHLAAEAFLVQPFEPDVVVHGEDTLVMVGGRFTHALTKRARAGDFRVQDDHGGTVHPCDPEPAQIALAEAALAVRGRPPAYGRVDMVRRADGGWAVMELELVEPELWLRRHPPAAVALAGEIAARIRAG